MQTLTSGKKQTTCFVDTQTIRKNILHCSHVSGHGHIPTSFSVVELIAAAYHCMRHDPSLPAWEDRDLFVLSKGHAALGYYCVLAEFGYFPATDVEQFGANNSRFGCHPDRFKVPGVEVSCGSLGHGIGVAAGMALSLKIKKSNRQVFVLIGDGESNEGTVWEAIMVAADQGLDNLTILYDYNRSQERCLQVKRPRQIFEAFGCQTFEVDGHNMNAVVEAIKTPNASVKCIVGKTIKGYGCQTLVDNVFPWHRRSPSDEEFNHLLKELDA